MDQPYSVFQCEETGMWAIRLNKSLPKRMPTGEVVRLGFPAMQITDWLKTPELFANDVARELNAFPDLLEAMKEAQAFIEIALPQYAQDRRDAVEVVLPKIRAAIAKAEAR